MGLVAIAIQNLPAIIDSLKGFFHQANPGAPLPTDEEVIAAYQQALASSLAKDAAWLAAHPETSADVRGSDDC
jgi:hypothetical protein